MAASRVCSARLKKLRPRTVRPLTGRGWVRRSERPDAGREVVQSGEVFEVAAVATEQDVSEVGEAVDVLFDRSKGFRILGGDVAALKTWLEQTLVQITSSSSCSTDSESIEYQLIGSADD